MDWVFPLLIYRQDDRFQLLPLVHVARPTPPCTARPSSPALLEVVARRLRAIVALDHHDRDRRSSTLHVPRSRRQFDV